MKSVTNNRRLDFYNPQKSCYEPPPPPPVKTDKSARRELAADGAVVDPAIGDALHTNASVPQISQTPERSFWFNVVLILYVIMLLL